jgi:hypothetical protein
MVTSTTLLVVLVVLATLRIVSAAWALMLLDE